MARAVTCNDSRREVTVLQNVANKQVDRVFTFDKVLFFLSTFSSSYFSRNTMLLYVIMSFSKILKGFWAESTTKINI